MTRVLGAVLAGGRARRFGADKAVAMLAGRRLIDWVTDALGPVSDDIVVCGRAGGLADRPIPDLGPLGGLNAALHFGLANGFDAVLSAPCDAPLIAANGLARLIEAGAPACFDNCPVVGLWSCSSADALDDHLRCGNRSMRGWARRVDAAVIRPEEIVVNINTREDLASANALR